MPSEFNPLYYNTLDQIYHASWATQKLARLELLKHSIHRLWPDGHPTQFIQVSGTSGKGSVCRYLEAGFSTCGTAGCYINPHLFDYRERFSIQQQPVSQADIIEIWEDKIKPLCLDLALKKGEPVHLYADIGILIALSLFDKYKVERAAIESGCGGRYAKARVLDAIAVAVTNVGQDHERTLGSEEWQRALDKGGACRPNRPLFTSAQSGETLRILECICQSLKSPFHHIDIDDLETFQHTVKQVFPKGLPDESLMGSGHQQWNAALSLAIVNHLLPNPNPKEIVKRFANIRFQGRFQKIEAGIYADIAHNPPKVQALVREVKTRFPSVRKIFVLGLAGNRSPKQVFAPILTIADRLIITSASYEGISPEQIHKELSTINPRKIPLEVIEDPPTALAQAKLAKDPEDIVILTGSTYAIDQMLNPDPYLRHINATYGWRMK